MPSALKNVTPRATYANCIYLLKIYIFKCYNYLLKLKLKTIDVTHPEPLLCTQEWAIIDANLALVSLSLLGGWGINQNNNNNNNKSNIKINKYGAIIKIPRQ